MFGVVTAAATCCALVAGAGLAVAATSAVASHRAVTAVAVGETWSAAQEVPGSAALNVAGRFDPSHAGAARR